MPVRKRGSISAAARSTAAERRRLVAGGDACRQRARAFHDLLEAGLHARGGGERVEQLLLQRRDEEQAPAIGRDEDPRRSRR